MNRHQELTPALETVPNPFAVTKAVDFTDDEIDANWVDWPAEGGFATLLNVKSQMPRIIMGGKGTGRTHVMRHFSASVQAIRGAPDPVGRVAQEGIIGIYVHCSGLNASRFHGRGQSTDTWQSIFAHYTDIWLAQAVLRAFTTITIEQRPNADIQRAITEDVQSLLNEPSPIQAREIGDLLPALHKMQRRIDRSVNNAALYPNTLFDVMIESNPGELVFGIPLAIRRHYDAFKDVTFLYLLDEFENFTETQQQYINSLIRETHAGASFIIGVRTYGLRTLATLTPEEENKRGSEFHEIRQDKKYTGRDRSRYKRFCQNVVSRRLREHGLIHDADHDAINATLSRYFELPNSREIEREIIKRAEDHPRPYFARLARQLHKLVETPYQPSLGTIDVESIIECLSEPTRPMLEKVNVLLFYRAWAGKRNLSDTAREIQAARSTSNRSGEVLANSRQRGLLDYYKRDLEAQLYQDARLPIPYAGLDEFITMSDGLPRNLLVILKNIFQWAIFNGEKPFRGQRISLNSQRLGVLATAEWFFGDARPLGTDGEDVHAAIGKLADMLRLLRFSDKPVECSLSSFSGDLTTCSKRAREVIHLCEQWALLHAVNEGQKDRNSGLVEPKFHLNRMLCPRWNLPIARRGAIRLNNQELTAIFDPADAENFRPLLRLRLATMNAPFIRESPQQPVQPSLNFDS